MTDIIDRANAQVERQRERAIRQITERPHETPCFLDGVQVCLDCDEPIPHARLKAEPHAVRCVYCEGRREKYPHG